MRAEGGKFDRAGTRLDQVAHLHTLRPRMQRRVKREIDTRLLRGGPRFARQALTGADQFAVVIGHVDDGRHASGGGRAGRPDEVFLVFLAAAMHLSIDRAGKHEAIAIFLASRAGGSRAGAHLRNFSARHSDKAVVDNLVGENDPAPHTAIDRVHPLLPEDASSEWDAKHAPDRARFMQATFRTSASLFRIFPGLRKWAP